MKVYITVFGNTLSTIYSSLEEALLVPETYPIEELNILEVEINLEDAKVYKTNKILKMKV